MGAAPILTILKNGETIKSQSLEGEVMLGRSEGCVIRLDDRAISRQHAVLRPVAGGVQIEKKSEVAPMSVNGAECTRALIKEGDVISIGPYLLKLSMSGVSARSALGSVRRARTHRRFIGPARKPRARICPAVEAVATARCDFLGCALKLRMKKSTRGTERRSSGDERARIFAGTVAPAESGPVDLGEISIDEDAKTKVLSAAKVSAALCCLRVRRT